MVASAQQHLLIHFFLMSRHSSCLSSNSTGTSYNRHRSSISVRIEVGDGSPGRRSLLSWKSNISFRLNRKHAPMRLFSHDVVFCVYLRSAGFPAAPSLHTQTTRSWPPAIDATAEELHKREAIDHRRFVCLRFASRLWAVRGRYTAVERCRVSCRIRKASTKRTSFSRSSLKIPKWVFSVGAPLYFKLLNASLPFLNVQVKYSAHRDRPVEERKRRFVEELREGHSVIVSTYNLFTVFNSPPNLVLAE